MTDIASLAIQIDTSDVARAEKDLAKLNGAGVNAERAAKGVEDAFSEAAKAAGVYRDATGRLREANGKLVSESRKVELGLQKVGDHARRASSDLSGLSSVAGKVGFTIASAFSVQQMVSYADAWSDMSSRVRLSIGAQETAADVMSRIGDIARGTYSSITATAEAFAQNSVTLRALGKSTQEQLIYTEALNNALVVSGAKGERAQMVQNSLARAMAEGALRGEDLNNVLNSGSRVAELLADELGVNITALRGIAAEGKITGDVIYNSLTKNIQTLTEEAGSMPATVSDGFLLIRDAALQSVGVFDQQAKLSEDLAEGLVDVADVIRATDWSPYINAGITAAKVYATYKAVVIGIPAAKAAASAATVSYQAVLAGFTAQAAVTTSTLLSMRSALGVVGAAFAGWQIGTYLRNEFEVVEKAGIALMSGLHQSAVFVGGMFKEMGETIKFAVSNPIAYARGQIADFLEWVSGLGAGALRLLGLEGLAERVQTEFQGVRGVTASEHQAMMQSIRAQTRAEMDSISDIYFELFSEVGESSGASAGAVGKLNEEIAALGEGGTPGSIANIDSAFAALYDSLFPAEAAQRKYNQQIELLKKHLAGDKLAEAIRRLNASIGGGDHSAAADAIEEYRKKFERLHDELNPAEVAAREYAEQQKLLNDIIARGGEEAEKARGDLVKLREQYEANNREASQWAQLTEDAFERVSERGADMWEGFFESGKFSFDSLLDVARRWAAEMANALTIKPLLTSLGNAILGTNTQGGLADVWGGLLGGSGGSSGAGNGFGLQDGLSIANTARNAYSLYSVGLAGMANTWGGYMASAGNWLGMSSLGNFGIGMQGATLAPGLAGPTTVGASGSMGAGAQLGSGLSNMGSVLSGPVGWVLAALLGSYAFGQAGHRLDHRQIARTDLSRYSLAIDPLGSAALDFGLTKPAELGQRTLSKIVGEKWGSILSGGALISGLHNTLSRAIFGSGEQFEREVGSARGVYSGGAYTGRGSVESWFGGERRFGDDFDSALHDLSDLFSASLGGLFERFDIDTDIETEALARLRRTSGKLLAGFTASFDDAVVSISGQYSKKGDIQSGLEAYFDDVMGRGLAEAIAASSLPDYLKELVEGLTKADEVGGAISGLFQRFESVNATVEMLNLSAFELTDAGLRGADALLELTSAIAGLENPTVVDQIASLGTLTSAYYENFFSETERTQHTLDAVARAFERADVTLAGSRAEYRAMVEDIDLTTEAGRQMFATLMNLAGQAAQYYSIIEQQTASALMGAVDSAYGRLQRSVQVERDRLTREYQAALAQEQAAQAAAQSAAQARSAALNDMAATANANAQALRSLGNELDRALRGLIGATESGAQMLRRQAVETLEEALTLGRSGRSLASIEGLDKAVSSAAAVDKSIYSSLEDFEREQGRTANLIAELSKINGRQLTAEEKLAADLRASAASINVSIRGVSSQLTAEYERAMAALDEELNAAQAQLDALNGIDRSVMSVADAIAQMSAAVTAAMGGQEAAIRQMYQSILGKPANDAGLQFWTDRIGQSGDYSELYRELTQAAQGQAGMQNAIADLYKQSGQTVDAHGLQFWSDAIASGQYSYDDLRRGLGIPAFASGGFHSGGLRLVGENGPELEVTGPSRIYNASQTAAMLGGAGSTEELRALRGEVAGLRSALGAIAKYTESTAYGVRQMNEIGLPQGEAA